MSGKKLVFSPRELELIELLKSTDIQGAADKMKIKRKTVDSMLDHIRDKIEWTRDAVNLSANWLDGAKYPRLAKVLRRQE